MNLAPKPLDEAETAAAEAPPQGLLTHASGALPCGSRPAPVDEARWFVIEAKPYADEIAHENLQRQHFASFLPRIAERTKRGICAVPLFPGYLFVRFNLAADHWRPIVSTKGVQRLMGGQADRPTPLRPGVIEKLLAEANLREIITDPTPALIEAGAMVRVTDGPFASLEGVCLWSKPRRVALLMQVFGRATEIEIERTAVVAT